MNKVYSTLAKNIILPLSDKMFNTKLMFWYYEISKLNKLCPDELFQWQNQQLHRLIQHAYLNTAYYKRIFNKLNLKPEHIKTVNDLKNIPPLTKNDIRNYFDELIPKNINNIGYKRAATGGSTGDPCKYLLDYNTWSFITANCLMYREQAGYNIGDRFISLGSTSLFINKKLPFKNYLYYKFRRKISLSGINMSDSTCVEYINLIKEKNIRFIYGYASSIYSLAKYVLNNHIRINLDLCMTTSEILTDVFEVVIRQAFNCKILNEYGAADGGITAFSSSTKNFEVGYNTFVNTFGKYNSLVPAFLTDMLNYAMPLINYEVGDSIILKDRSGRTDAYNGQLIEYILGRESEIIVLENGNVLTGPAFTVLFKDIPVEYYRIENQNNNSIKCVINPIVGYTDEHERLIISVLKKHTGENIKIEIEYNGDIKYSSNGKRIYFCTI